MVVEDDLSSQIDGILTTFTIANNYVGGTIKIYLNGLRLQSGVGKDFEKLAPNQIVMSFAPEVGDILIADYIKN